MSEAQNLPSPMSEEREAVMRDRAANGEELAVPADNSGVTESIRRRHTSQRKNGFNATARSVRGPAKALAGDARFTEDGDEIGKASDFTALDRYLATTPGTDSAAHALRLWKQERELKTC